MFRFSVPLITLLALFILAGCSGPSDPISPDYTTDSPRSASSGLTAGFETSGSSLPVSSGHQISSADISPSTDGHELMGIRRIRLYDDGTVEILPMRIEQAHINVTKMILNCPTCLDITMGPPPGPNQFEFNITLTNPTNLTGYDVTGIIRASGDITLLNPDSYTYLFSYPGDTIPNPYVAWDTGVGNREFGGYAAHTQILRFEKGGITRFTEIDYLFQASWPDNQEEPHEISDLAPSAELQSNGLNTIDLTCHVGDWQDNVDAVTIDLGPIGGNPALPMTFTGDNTWTLDDVSYSPTGQGVGDHELLVTATSNGVSTYNYMTVTVVASGPIKDGPFLVKYQNLPLEPPDGPTDGMDIAVMGAADGTQVGMVFGGDDTYHFWSPDWRDGSFGLYYQDSGDPIMPFDVPNYRFDFADSVIPDSSVDSIFTLSWGESNTSEEVLDGTSIPQVIARQRIALWRMTGEALRLTSNVLVLGSDPGPPKTFDVIVRPVEFSSGFNQDGLLYMTLVFDSGTESEFPVVDIMAMKPPLDFEQNPNLYSGGYEIGLEQGTGAGKVSRMAVVGVDVDDSAVLPISGGYAGHAWAAVVEGGAENALEIVDADITSGDNVFVTVPLPALPRDCEILPLKNAGQSTNAICVLCGDNRIRLYDYTGTLLYTIGGAPYMTGSALRLDIDDTNLAIHVLHQGPQNPLVTTYEWDG